MKQNDDRGNELFKSFMWTILVLFLLGALFCWIFFGTIDLIERIMKA